MGSSKARRAKLRARRDEKFAIANARAAELRLEGHACLDCKHRMWLETFGRHICEPNSDFYGDSVVNLNDLCSKWSARA